MTYTIIDGVACGSAQLQVQEVFQKLPQILTGMHVVLTYMDSGPIINEDGKSRILSKYGSILGNAVLLNPLTQNEFVDLLDGFDEIFVVTPEALREFPLVGRFATPPYFSESLPDDFLQTFKAIGATCYLGDGIGLNYACDPKYAPLMEELPDLETYHLRVLPLRFDRTGPLDPQIIEPSDNQ